MDREGAVPSSTEIERQRKRHRSRRSAGTRQNFNRKYKGRVVLRIGIVKDDSGSYAVFTEQGSSASQMTAAKVMDMFIKIQDAQEKQQTQKQFTPRSKWAMHHDCSQFPGENIQIWRYVYQNTNGLNHRPVWKIRSFFWSETCTVIFQQDYLGKGNSRKFY